MRIFVVVFGVFVTIHANGSPFIDHHGLTKMLVQEMKQAIGKNMNKHHSNWAEADWKDTALAMHGGLASVGQRISNHEAVFTEEQGNNKKKENSNNNDDDKSLPKICRWAEQIKETLPKSSISETLKLMLQKCQNMKNQTNQLEKMKYHVEKKLAGRSLPNPCDVKNYTEEVHRFDKGNGGISGRNLLKKTAQSICQEKLQDRKMKELCKKVNGGGSFAEMEAVVDKLHSTVASKFDELESDIQKKDAQVGVPLQKLGFIKEVCKDFGKMNATERNNVGQKVNKTEVAKRAYEYFSCVCNPEKKNKCGAGAAGFMASFSNSFGKDSRELFKQKANELNTKLCAEERNKTKNRDPDRQNQNETTLMQLKQEKMQPGFAIKPDGTREFSLESGAVSCGLSWNPYFSSGSITGSCTIFEVVTASITVTPAQNTINVELALCGPGISDLVAVMEQIPGVGSWLNSNGIYGGCFRLGTGGYNWNDHNLYLEQGNLCVTIMNFKGCIPSGIYFRLQKGPAYSHGSTWNAMDDASGTCRWVGDPSKSKAELCQEIFGAVKLGLLQSNGFFSRLNNHVDTKIQACIGSSLSAADYARSQNKEMPPFSTATGTKHLSSFECQPWVHFKLKVSVKYYKVWLFGSGWRTLTKKNIYQNYYRLK